MFVLQVAAVKDRGGIATAIRHYERMFRAVGVRSAVLFSGPESDDLRAGGADIIPAPNLLISPFGRVPGVLAHMARAVVSRAGADQIVIIVHSDRALPALRAHFPNAVLVTPCHTDKTKHKAGADLVVTMNDVQHEAVVAALPRTRVRLLGNPFTPSPSQGAPAGEMGGAPRFNFLGRFEDGKDPLTLISAFSAAELPQDVTLRMIGAGPMESEVRLAAASAGARITFTGWLADAYAHFDARDVLVLTSRSETYSYVVREALHFGVPVIASDIPVHRAVLENGAFGLLFATGDRRALAAAIATVAADVSEFRRRASYGGGAVRARYGAAPFFAEFRDAIGA